MEMVLDEYKVKLRMLELRMDHYSDLAREAGITDRTVRNVVGTGNWRADTVSKIAVALQCNPLDLITVEQIGETGV
jgi:DNA-binding Xre family transcriptional regulator